MTKIFFNNAALDTRSEIAGLFGLRLTERNQATSAIAKFDWVI